MVRLLSVAVFLFTLGCSLVQDRSDTVWIRVENASSIAFESVWIGPEDFGELAPESTSEYRVVEVAYRDPGFAVQTAAESLEFYPIDYMGAPTLSPGRYTYILIANPDLTELDLALIEDG
ncbi:MAG: hypothetical protein GEU90_05475 [Gemmatimonas sp.]|nr:hypothetical protein [Gemmatimonas sp.]